VGRLPPRVLLALALVGCQATPDGGGAEGVGLLALAPAEIRVDAPQPAIPSSGAIAIPGPWLLAGAEHGVRSYTAPLPVRPRALFYERAPDGMELHADGAAWRYGAGRMDAWRPGTWEMDATHVTVRLDPEAPRPDSQRFTLIDPRAQAREAALYRDEGAELPAFVRRAAQVGDTTREGVYLPAPSRIAWDVPVPAGGVLSFEAAVLPPEVDDGTRSDGASLRVEVDGTRVHASRVDGRWRRVRVPLHAHAGRTVRLSLTTEDADTIRDHVFIAGPAIYVPRAEPRRVVLAFVDTLRRDHVGFEGYRRATTPGLDAWAKGARVFDDARTVAPWTLPSARTLLTGRAPEDWSDSPTLQELLGARGWATGAMVGNVYLSGNFDMSAGWDEHRCVNWPSAEVEVARARDFLRRNDDRDALLLVHFMDLHLPYKEPPAWRSRWAGRVPPGLPWMFNRTHVLQAVRNAPDAVRTHVVDRYDQNLAYVDAQLAPLLSGLGAKDVSVLVSDHGEEFWDHGDFEHGHTLHDELLRIPLAIRGPALAAGRSATPASLADVVPTVLDLLGIPAPPPWGGGGSTPLRNASPGAGVSLRVDGDAGRARAFGRPLYGPSGWGVVHGNEKYVTRAGSERTFDLAADPEERHDRRGAEVPLAARAALAGDLGTQVVRALRVAPGDNAPGGPWTLELQVPGGVAAAWAGDDPTMLSKVDVVPLDAERVRITYAATEGLPREVFLQPAAPSTEAGLPGLRVRLGGAEPVTVEPTPDDGSGRPLARVADAHGALVLTWAMVPRPRAGGTALNAVDGEVRGALEALGYLQGVR
jgi:arylsulfatase A-like enzyme